MGGRDYYVNNCASTCDRIIDKTRDSGDYKTGESIRDASMCPIIG